MIWRFRERQHYRPGLNIGYPHTEWPGGPWRCLAFYVPGIVTFRVWLRRNRPTDLHAFWRAPERVRP